VAKEGEDEESPSKTEDDQINTKTEVKEGEEDENVIPAEEDCWEYKLVGINVHSGSANGGHYWSYINTERHNAEGEND
jgi:ubiquitin C-terminal hydrolase